MKTIFKKITSLFNRHTLIELSDADRKLIKLCKLHYRDDPRFKNISGGWIESLKPLFEDLYGWSVEDDYNGFLYVMFDKLLRIVHKIAVSEDQKQRIIRDAFIASFSKRPYAVNMYELPVERTISKLCSEIQCNRVLTKNGKQRYILDEE